VKLDDEQFNLLVGRFVNEYMLDAIELKILTSLVDVFLSYPFSNVESNFDQLEKPWVS